MRDLHDLVVRGLRRYADEHPENLRRELIGSVARRITQLAAEDQERTERTERNERSGDGAEDEAVERKQLGTCPECGCVSGSHLHSCRSLGRSPSDTALVEPRERLRNVIERAESKGESVVPTKFLRPILEALDRYREGAPNG